MYRDYNEIDNEILELITDQIRFEDIKSLLDKKYVYINKENKTINNILFNLFSSQSYLSSIKDKYENFIQILYNERINKSMLSQIQLSIVDFLLKEKIIQETNREMEMFRKFREFSKTHPEVTYEEFIKASM